MYFLDREILIFQLVLVLMFFSRRGISKKPNIILIVADDLGWNDLGLHGSEIPTPNLDALAYHGVVLNRHYSQPMCSASRGALLTSKYPHKIGMSGPMPLLAGSQGGIPLQEKLFPQYLKKLGYSNHLVGKWHVGMSETAYLPTMRGFDSYFGFLTGYIGFYDGTHLTWKNENHRVIGLDFRRNLKGAWEEVFGKYVTYVLTDEAVKLIKEKSKQGGLFLVLAQSAVHTGNPGPSKLLKTPNGLDKPRRDLIKDEERQMFADIVKELDDSVGNITTALESEGALENSIIVFVSDNGGVTNDLMQLKNIGSNWPLRGQKFTVFEGGVRTVSLMWSPKIKKPGTSYENLFHLVDWLPTLYEAAGGDISDLGENLDGVSHWQSISTGNSEIPRKNVLNVLLNNSWAIQNKEWKLLKNGSPKEFDFATGYLGDSGRGLRKYDMEEVKGSPTWNALKLHTSKEPDETAMNNLRSSLLLEKACQERTKAGLHPQVTNLCKTQPCLFNILEDPCEFQDLSSSNPEVVNQLSMLIENHRKDSVAELVNNYDPNSLPALWNNYWTPWVTSES